MHNKMIFLNEAQFIPLPFLGFLDKVLRLKFKKFSNSWPMEGDIQFMNVFFVNGYGSILEE